MAVSLSDLSALSPRGQPWLPGGSGGGLSNWNSWGQTPDMGSGGGFVPSTIPTPNWATPPATPATTATSSGSLGPFTAETLAKNPDLAAILKKLYPQIGNLSTDPNVNQTVLQQNVKLPAVQAAGQAALTQQQADAHNNAQSIADFAKDFMASQPAAQTRAEQEAANLGSIQSGALAASLDANQRSSDINSTQNLMRRLGTLAGTQNLGDLSRGGVTNSGANANILRAAADASLARDAAALAGHRQNIMDVTNLQTSTAGQAQRILDAVLQRRLVPVQAGQASAAADLSRLGGVSSILQNNSVFTPQTQAGMIAQIQQLLQGQAGLDPAANYRFVQGNFPNQMPGVVPQQGSNFPNPYANQGAGNQQTLQQILDAIRGGGLSGANPAGAQPSLIDPTVGTRGPMSSMADYQAVLQGQLPAGSFRYPVQPQTMDELITNSLANPSYTPATNPYMDNYA